MMAGGKLSGSDLFMRYKETPELLSEEHFTEDETTTNGSATTSSGNGMTASEEEEWIANMKKAKTGEEVTELILQLPGPTEPEIP